MKIIVASLNPQKIAAVQELAIEYPLLDGFSIEAISVPSHTSDQPKSLQETIEGAINRAKNAFNDCTLSFGLESGLMEVPYSKTGTMDICACAIYDGENIHLGLSSAFEPPHSIQKLMSEGMIMSDAAAHLGLTTNMKVGSAEGLVGILTNGRLDRRAQTKQAVLTAFIHLENADLYKK